MKQLGIALVALLALACGGSSSPEAQEPQPVTTEPAPAAPAATAPTDPAAGAGDPLANLSEAEVARGKEIYQGECAFCHGDNAEGSKKSPALRGTGAMARFTSNQELFDYTRAEMPKSDPGSLSAADTAAVLAWLKSAP